VTGSPDDIAGAIRAMGEAGADEIILVLDPITERSIASMRPVLAAL
jgi:alkanesulfonate monooxygenase SsuD/methylene tetrahydromethanopterin reductase-like flavin-dependent oxidoreductase (luciferase family)